MDDIDNNQDNNNASPQASPQASPRAPKKEAPKKKPQPKKEAEPKPKKKEAEPKPKKKEDSDDEAVPFNPEYQAQMVVAAIKQYQLQVYAKVVDLGDDNDYGNLIKCMTAIRESQHKSVQDCSILLISGGDKYVVALAHSANIEKINPREWIQAALESLPHEDNTLLLGDTQGRVVTTNDAPPIKAKETALANNFAYLRKIGAMPKDDEEDDQFVDYAEML